jgi:hypothetical protein
MRFKGTFVLLIVCLALGSYVYFYEIKGGEQRDKAKEEEKQIWKLNETTIKQIDLNSAGQHITAVRNNQNQWSLTSPRALDADVDEMNYLARAASNIVRESAVESNSTDLSRFGLSPAKISLKIKTRDNKEYAIDFGNNNPIGNSIYAVMPGKKNVFFVSNASAGAFNKKTDELRNHRVLSFDQPEVDYLNIKSSKGNIELTKDGNDQWWIAGSEKIAADSPGVRGILNALSTARTKEFFDHSSEDYPALNFNKPIVDIRITYGKNRAIKHLVIGPEKSSILNKNEKTPAAETVPSSTQYLAKDDSRSDLFLVEKDLIDKLLKSPVEIRDKALATFQRWDIDSIALTNTKGSFAFIKSGGEWFVGGIKKKAKWESINAILDAMEKPVKSWIDKPESLSTYGLDKPPMHVILKRGDTIVVDCSLGKAEKDGGIYALIKGNSFVKIADPDGIGALDKSESDLVEKQDPAAKSQNK